MTNYHIGKEIEKEMHRQGMKPEEFADAVCRARGTVYDIFNKSHIATDQLANICRVLNRDFFSELSRSNFGHEEMDVEEEVRIKEMISGLMPEDKLHTFTRGYLLNEVIREFLPSERTKPLVVFYYAKRVKSSGINLPTHVEHIAMRMRGEEIDASSICMPDKTNPGLPLMSRCGNLISLIANNTDYASALRMAEEQNRDPEHHVVLYIPVKGWLSGGEYGGIVYENVANQLFSAWKNKAHFLYVPDGGSALAGELYQAYCGTGTIDNLIEAFDRGEDDGLLLYEYIFGHGVLDVEEIREEDSTGLSRIRIFYRGIDKIPSDVRELLNNNGVNNNPRLDMWLDIRNGVLVDYQYNKRTQPDE